ncbi:MAG TPA: AAA family ATPase [Gemmatimonadales bacterium]|nr:AAA family ATPase [Gemmatimonadales bacterium]
MTSSSKYDVTPGVAALASYTSALELRDIAAHAGGPLGPRMETRPAAVLFADLAGFTALAEALSLQGPRGAEDLSRIIDAHFGRLTDIVLAAGGDILVFAGDAALAAWPADEGADLVAAVTAAAACGLRLQEAGDHPRTGSLRMRISVGVGSLAHLRVGGVSGRWLSLAHGAPIAQAAAADRLAREGEVILSPEAALLLERGAEGSPLEGGALRLAHLQPPVASITPRPVAPDPDWADEIRRLVPEIIAARVDAGLGEWLGEFRRVTMVFCGLGVIDPGEPDALGQIQEAVAALQGEVERLEGTVYQLLTDDKGTTLVAAFGLPPRAHEDDAARGTLAALAMHAALLRHGLTPSVGIATGLLYSGVYGTTRRRQYTVAGPPVNLAARLMQHAAGALLCDAATEERARRHPALRFAPMEPLRVKGREQPVVVHRPWAEQGAAPSGQTAGGEDRLRGRERECAALDAAMESLVTRRQGGVVLIEGEPGIGKSRLIEYVRGHGIQRGARVLDCAGDDIEKATAYHAWIPPMRSLAGTDPQLLSTRLGLRPEHAPIVPLLGPLLGLKLGGNELIAAMTDEVRAANVRNLLLAALAHLGDAGPVVVTIEDAQWLDSSSWSLLLAAARTIPTLLFVVTNRPFDDPPADFVALAGLAGERRLRLAPLGPEAVEPLLADRLGVRSVPASVLALVHDRAAGNPFFSEELVYALRDYGLIVVADGRCALADPTRELAPAFAEALAARGLPPTLQGVVTSRIDRLTQTEQFVVKVASVIGRTFSVAMLRDVFPIPISDAELAASLATVQRLDLIRPETDAGDPRYTFRHAITQQVAYDLTLYAQRRDLHRAVGAWLEAQHAADLDPVLPLLAFHWRRAEVTPKAVFYLDRAGDQAFRSYANAEAVGFLRDALLLSPDADASQRRRWEMQAGRACVNWSRYEEGEAHLRRGLALAGEQVPRGNARLVGAILGQATLQMIHRLFAARLVGRRAPERDVLLSAAHAHEALVEVFYLRDANLACLHSAMRGLNLAELAGPSPELARAYATVGAILGFIPLPKQADAYCRRALETARATGDVPATIWTALSVGAYKLGVAAWEEARALFDLVTSESERLGDARRWDDGIQFLIDLHFLQGRFETSLDLAGRLYRSATQRNDPRGQASAVYRRVHCELVLGHDAEAATAAEQLAGLRWNVGTVHGDLPLRSVQGLTRLRAGDPAGAEDAALEAAALLKKVMPAYHGYVFDAAGTADVLLQLLEQPGGRDGPAGAKRMRGLRAALGALRRLARVFPIARPWLALLGGRAKRLEGKTEAAHAQWQAAVALGERLAMPYPAALARQLLTPRAS